MTTNIPDVNAETVQKLLDRGLDSKLRNYYMAETQARLRSEFMVAKPYWLTIDPTNFCQLQCPFCPTGQRRNVRPKAAMDIEKYKKLMSELGPALIHADFMNWGEPLLNEHIWEMIALAKTYRIETMLSSNLNHFKPDWAEKMVLSGLDRLTVSLDGTNQENYSKYRVNGDFSAVISHIREIVSAKKKLHRLNPRITWQFLVFRHNETAIDEAKAMAKDLGVDDIGFTAPNLPFRPGIKDEWLSTRKEYALYDRDSFPESPPWEWEQAKQKDADGKPKEIEVSVYAGDKTRDICKWPWTAIAVNPDGSVSPCCSVEEQIYDFGNIFEEGFEKLWNNARYRQARRHIRDYAAGTKESIPASDHACERCFSIGKSNFILPHWWQDASRDPYPDPLRAPDADGGKQ